MRLASAALVLAATISPVLAADWSGTYACTSTASGGVGFSGATGAWEGRAFEPDWSFELVVELQGTETTSLSGRDVEAADYAVTIDGESCGADGALVRLLGNQDEVICEGNPIVHFSLENPRFVALFPHGYLYGAPVPDSAEFSPHVDIGTCVKG